MKKLGLCIAIGLSLSACASMNNGTAAGNTGNVVTEYPVEAAMLNIYTKERSQKLMAVVTTKMYQQKSKSRPKAVWCSTINPHKVPK